MQEQLPRSGSLTENLLISCRPNINDPKYPLLKGFWLGSFEVTGTAVGNTSFSRTFPVQLA